MEWLIIVGVVIEGGFLALFVFAVLGMAACEAIDDFKRDRALKKWVRAREAGGDDGEA